MVGYAASLSFAVGMCSGMAIVLWGRGYDLGATLKSEWKNSDVPKMEWSKGSSLVVLSDFDI